MRATSLLQRHEAELNALRSVLLADCRAAHARAREWRQQYDEARDRAARERVVVAEIHAEQVREWQARVQVAKAIGVVAVLIIALLVGALWEVAG